MPNANAFIRDLLERLEIEPVNSGACYGAWISDPSGGELASVNPATGETLARVRMAGVGDYDCVVERARAAFQEWRMMPAPKRGEIVREIGNELRARKADLGALVTLEMGKILAEGQGEVQEMIDIADFAVGLSRQLYGLTMTSERPGHRMYEQWHPLGVVGVISAFNFPVAVWSWNAFIAAVCGDCVLWRPSSETPLTAIAVEKICNRVTDRHNLEGIFNLAIGPSRTVGEALIGDARIPLVSFTGSTEVGRHVSETVARRLGRSILELGGNNGVIVMNDANFDLALRAILFGAVGTTGQRCTTTRRAFLERAHCAAHDRGARERVSAGANWRSNGREHADGAAGEPARGGRHDGRDPPHTGTGRRDFVRRREDDGLLRRADAGARAARYADSQRGDLRAHSLPGGVRQPGRGGALAQRRAAGALFGDVHDQPDRGGDVPEPPRQRLRDRQHQSSAPAARKSAERFGGEKDTGGGRESGSDAWKAYMRRQTNTINWSEQLPLAQGIRFEV